MTPEEIVAAMQQYHETNQSLQRRVMELEAMVQELQRQIGL
jgi:prefoldin subunit 5